MNTKEGKLLVTVMQHDLQQAIINESEWKILNSQHESLIYDKKRLVNKCKYVCSNKLLEILL